VIDPEFGQFLAQLGVGGVIAGLLIFFYRKDVKAYTDLWRDQTVVLLDVVKENTRCTAENTEVLRALHKRMDTLELIRVVSMDKEGQGVAAQLGTRP
jgi:hypothetical protein